MVAVVSTEGGAGARPVAAAVSQSIYHRSVENVIVSRTDLDLFETYVEDASSLRKWASGCLGLSLPIGMDKAYNYTVHKDAFSLMVTTGCLVVFVTSLILYHLANGKKAKARAFKEALFAPENRIPLGNVYVATGGSQ